jgi:hypothetical protein
MMMTMTMTTIAERREWGIVLSAVGCPFIVAYAQARPTVPMVLRLVGPTKFRGLSFCHRL